MTRKDILRALHALDRMPISKTSRPYLDAEYALLGILAALESRAYDIKACAPQKNMATRR